MRTLRDAIYGVAVGDALGSPVQFMERGSYPKVTEMVYCHIFDKEAGTWTDDTSMTLALCDSIKQCGAIDTEDIYNLPVADALHERHLPRGMQNLRPHCHGLEKRSVASRCGRRERSGNIFGF